MKKDFKYRYAGKEIKDMNIYEILSKKKESTKTNRCFLNLIII